MTASDFLISSGGRLDASWFEPHTLNSLLTAWLADSSGSDQAVEAQVYARAFETVVSLVMSDPANQRDRDKSDAYTDRQLAYWQQQAAYWRGRVDALTGNNGPVVVQWEGDPTWQN